MSDHPRRSRVPRSPGASAGRRPRCRGAGPPGGGPRHPRRARGPARARGRARAGERRWPRRARRGAGPMSRALLDALDAMAGRRVLVVGEAMLDTYLIGSANRLSREAPVPVVAVEERVDAAGGAANSAVNLRALGARVEFLSVVGTDDEADRLRAALGQAGVPDHDVLGAPDRRTLAKHRVLAGEQMLVRFDSGTTAPLPVAIEDE